MKLSNTVIKPIITEKTYSLANEGRYVFMVGMEATKGSVEKELDRIYGVDAIDIQISIMPGKRRRMMKSRLLSEPKRWKKAVVKLKKGQTIDLFPKE